MLKNTIKLLSFLGLMSLFIIIDFNLFRFYFSTTSTIILIINCVFYGSILLLQGFILGSIGGQFSKPKEPESSSQITTIQDLKQTHFEMLEQIANLINKIRGIKDTEGGVDELRAFKRKGRRYSIRLRSRKRDDSI